MIGTQRCPQCEAPLAADAPEGLCPECLLGQAVGATGDWQNGSAADSPNPAGFIPPRPGELAQHFPQLEILELLGQGGMGAVYKARQSKLDRLVALKILPPAWGRDPAFAERFSREARALAQLSHPNTIAVHDFGETGGLYYFIMEYVDGANLRQLLQAGPIGPREALDVAAQVCDALQYAHEQGIIHRDIKPENILLDQRGRVKIADFGLAKLLGTVRPVFTLTGSRQVVGTPHYMAPEQMEKPHTVDHRADLYSLGVVFYEMLTGELPLGRFSAPSQKGRMDERLDHVVLRSLEKDPERRYQRARELRADLEAIRRTAPLPIPNVVPAGRYDEELANEMTRFRMIGPTAGLTLTAMLAFAFWMGMGIVGLVNFLYDMRRYHYHDDEVAAALCAVLFGAPAVILACSALVAAGRFLKRYERYEFVLLAALWAMVPWSPAVVIGLPVGIWTLVVLLRPEVKQAFARRALHDRLGLAPPLPGALKPAVRRRGFVLRAVRSVVGGVFSLVAGSRARAEEPSTAGVVSAGEPQRAWVPPAVPVRSAGAEPAPGRWPPPAPPRRRRSLWPWVAGACLIGLLLACLLSIPLSYLATGTSATYKPPGPAPRSVDPRFIKDDLAEWQYPGSTRGGFGESRSSRHARFTTTDDLEKVASWYERQTGARFTGAVQGGHGAGSVGDLYYDYQDDSLPLPDNRIGKQPRPVGVRILVVRRGQWNVSVVITRAQAEEQTHIAVTRVYWQ